MRRYLLTVCLAMLIAVLVVPSQALANWHLGIGTGITTSSDIEGAKATYTGQLVGLGEGWVGFEFDYGFMKSVREGIGGRTLTFGVLVGKPFGRIRPYGTVGAGGMGAVTSFKGIFVPSEAAPIDGAIAAGGGVFASLGERLGVRVDARMIRAAKPASEPFSTFSMVRISGGVTLGF